MPVGTVIVWYTYGCGSPKTRIRNETLRSTLDVDMLVRVFPVGILNHRYWLDAVVTSHNGASEVTTIFVCFLLHHLAIIA